MVHEHHQRSDAVNISISKKGIERIFYWIVILVLLVLLVVSYVSDSCNCDATTNTTANVAIDTNSGNTQTNSGLEPNVVEPKSEDIILPLPVKKEVEPEPEPEPETEPEPEPEPEPELSGIVEFAVPVSGIKVEELDNKVKITQLPIRVTNGKTFALEGYKALIYAYGDDEDAAAVKSKERVEKDGFVIPVVKSGETKEVNLDLSEESIFNVVNEVIIKVKLFDDRNKLLDSITIEKKV